MSDLDDLSESARNRGLKLVRSRVRSPTKRRFGKVGLTDAKGQAVFGMDDKGPVAKPEAVEDYLRNLGAQDWGASLDVPVAPRKRRPKPKPAPNPKPPPKPEIREARATDAPRLVELMQLLGHGVDEKGVRKRLSTLARPKMPQLVATLDKRVVGLAGLHIMVAVHRAEPVGRITILVVEEEARKHGIGRLLVEAAETALRKQGCGMIEVTSNDRLTTAHEFYRHLGYERTSIRLFKTL